MDIATPLEQQVEKSKSNIDAKIFRALGRARNALFYDCIHEPRCYDCFYSMNFRSDGRGACYKREECSRKNRQKRKKAGSSSNSSPTTTR